VFTTYHGTDCDFETFAARPQPKEDAVGNCSLGHWVSFSSSVAASFGDSLLIIDVEPERVATMSVRDLLEMHQATQHEADRGHASHAAYAEQLRSEGYDFLAIEEADGRVGVGVILDTACIDGLERARSVDHRKSGGTFDFPYLNDLLHQSPGMAA
jgi:hypothetical protein